MNRAEFKAISHEYRELNFKAHSSSHICTARNCSCRDEHLYRHTGWQWRIAQQHGEAMATRIARMFDWRYRNPTPTISPILSNALNDLRMRRARRAAMKSALARCDELFRSEAA